MFGLVSGLLIGGMAVWLIEDKRHEDQIDELLDKTIRFESIANTRSLEAVELRNRAYKLETEVHHLKVQLSMANEVASRKVDPVMKEAAKKAMMASHPDITRKHTEDEFIKFKRLYDSLK